MYPKDEPGDIRNNEVIGEYSPSDKVIGIANIKKREANAQNQIVRIKLYDGRVMNWGKNTREIGRNIYQMLKENISLSEIEKFGVKRVDFGLSILATTGIIYVLVAVLLSPGLSQLGNWRTGYNPENLPQ